LTNQNRSVPQPQTGLRSFQDILRRNPVALFILVILGIGVLSLLNNLGSGPSGSVSIPSSNTSTQSPPLPAAAPADWFEDASAAYNRDDFATAIRIIRPLAEQGNAKAQAFLGLMYAEGHGVPQDYAEAMKWYRRAADQRDTNALMFVAFMYRDGHGVPQDYIRAYMWLTLAAQSNEPANVPGHYTPAQTASMGRDDVARHMTPAQISEAQKLASEWKPER
jgi:uncharacterized protein